MKCAACCCIIDTEEEYVRCTIDRCNKLYHFLCAGGKDLVEPRITWICPECRCATKKGGDNTLTPVGSAKKPRDSNITLRKKVESPCPTADDSSFMVQPSEVSSDEIRSLRQDMQSLKGQLSHAISLIISHESKMVDYAAEVKELNKRFETIVAIIGPNITSSVAPVTDLVPQVTMMAAPVAAAVPVPVSTPVQLNTAAVGDGVLTTQSPAQPLLAAIVSAAAAPTLRSAGHQGVVTLNEIQPGSVNLVPKRRKQKMVDSKVRCGQPQLCLELPACPPQVKSSDTVLKTAVTPRSTTTLIQDVCDTDQWTEVKKRRNQRPASLCGTACPAKTTLKAVKPRKYIHLWNMESGADDVRDYLNQLYPTGTCSVQELNPRGDYKSYKIGVPVDAYDDCLSTEIWPVNARIKAWIPYQKPVGNIGAIRQSMVPGGNNQPFRGSTKV